MKSPVMDGMSCPLMDLVKEKVEFLIRPTKKKKEKEKESGVL
jgi:hypothetical protein